MDNNVITIIQTEEEYREMNKNADVPEHSSVKTLEERVAQVEQDIENFQIIFPQE